MDKSTLGYGALFVSTPSTWTSRVMLTPQDLQTELHLHGQEYALLNSIVYVAQVICQPLSAYALVVFPVKYWVLANYIVWTACTMCCGELRPCLAAGADW